MGIYQARAYDLVGTVDDTNVRLRWRWQRKIIANSSNCVALDQKISVVVRFDMIILIVDKNDGVAEELIFVVLRGRHGFRTEGSARCQQSDDMSGTICMFCNSMSQRSSMIWTGSDIA